MNDLQPITLPGLDTVRPLLIAGPCSAETEEQVLTTAHALARQGVQIFRAGIWKPRGGENAVFERAFTFTADAMPTELYEEG